MRTTSYTSPFRRKAPLAAFLVLTAVQTAIPAILTHRYSFDIDASDSVTNAIGVLLGNAVVANGVLVLDGTSSSVQLPNDLFTSYDSISFEFWFADGAINSQNAQLYNFSGTNGGMSYLIFGQGTYAFGTGSNVVTLPSPAVGHWGCTPSVCAAFRRPHPAP